MTCETNGIHPFPTGEDSWGDSDCDRLFAVSMAGCTDCAGPLERAMCERLSDPFGKIFTTLVMQTVNLHMQIGAALPETADQMFANVNPPLAFATQRALGGVRLPQPTTLPGVTDVGVVALGGLDAREATERLGAMSRNERVEVLRDAMDQIIGMATAREMLKQL